MKRLKNLKTIAKKRFIPEMKKRGFEYYSKDFKFERVYNGVCQGIGLFDVSTAGFLEVYTYFKAIQVYDKVEYPFNIADHKYSYNFPGDAISWNIYDLNKNDFETFATIEQLEQILEDMLTQIDLFSIPLFAVFNNEESYIHLWALDKIHNKYDTKLEEDSSVPFDDFDELEREIYWDIEKNYLSKYKQEFDSLVDKAKNNIQKNSKAFNELNLFNSTALFPLDLQNIQYLTNDKFFEKLHKLTNYLEAFGFELNEKKLMYIRQANDFTYEKIKINRNDLVFFSVDIDIEDEKYESIFMEDDRIYSKNIKPKNFYQIYGVNQWFIGNTEYIDDICQEIINYLEENRILEEMRIFTSQIKYKKTSPSHFSNNQDSIELKCFSISHNN